MTQSGAEPAPRIESMVAEFVDAVTRADITPRERDRRIDDLDQLGAREISSSTLMAARVVDLVRPGGSPIVEKLSELRQCVEGRRGRRQRRRVQSILAELQDARADLEARNAALAQQRLALTTAIEGLQGYAQLTERLDAECTARAAPADVLDAVRRRRETIAMHLSVARQADAALQLMASNNRDVMRGIGVATTTTVAALSSSEAVTTALAALDEIERSNVLAVENLNETVTAMTSKISGGYGSPS